VNRYATQKLNGAPLVQARALGMTPLEIGVAQCFGIAIRVSLKIVLGFSPWVSRKTSAAEAARGECLSRSGKPLRHPKPGRCATAAGAGPRDDPARDLGGAMLSALR